MSRQRPDVLSRAPKTFPRVSIGLPVYNGGAHLEQAVRSYLEQDFEDLELLVSDNASTDDTEEICRQFARDDVRVRYVRLTVNHGAVANFNRVFRMARGEYFKWAAHDDWCRESYVSRCVEVLDSSPGVVLCQTDACFVLEDGAERCLERYDLTAPDPVRRFNHILWRLDSTYTLFGLTRSRVLAATPLLTRDVGSDRVLIGNLGLLGQFRQIPEVLLYLGEARAQRSIPRDSTYWAPENAHRLTLLSLRLAKGFADVVVNSDLGPADKGLLLASIWARYGIGNLPRLAYESYLTAGEIVHRRPYRTVVSSKGSLLRRW
jgi:glycosyltransferase involved in cell wall biosynthesis